MHARQLVELAALVSRHSPTLLFGASRLSPTGLESYWTASRCRLDRWLRTLKSHRVVVEKQSAIEQDLSWQETRPTVEEILASEALTRVWTGVSRVFDKARGQDEASAIAQSVLLGHMEARRRVLAMIVSGRLIEAAEAVAINRVRRKIEHWTDLLLGHIHAHAPVAKLGFRSDRVAEFGEEIRSYRRQRTTINAWDIALASLRVTLQATLSQAPSPNSDLNERIAGAVVSCLPAEVFDSSGLLKSLWLMRLCNGVADTYGLVEELLALDEIDSPDEGIFFVPR